jgi:hypothetical protein
LNDKITSMNKFLLSISAIAALLFGCKPAANYKSIREEVIQLHDSVMADTEIAYRNKRHLDTLAASLDSLSKVNPSLDTIKEKEQMTILGLKLDTAEAEMEDWMHKFEVEKGNKSDEEAVAYFNKEKMKIKSIDSLFTVALKESGNYLRKFGK